MLKLQQGGLDEVHVLFAKLNPSVEKKYFHLLLPRKNICSINHWSFLYCMQTSYNNVNVIVFIGRLKC